MRRSSAPPASSPRCSSGSARPPTRPPGRMPALRVATAPAMATARAKAPPPSEPAAGRRGDARGRVQGGLTSGGHGRAGALRAPARPAVIRSAAAGGWEGSMRRLIFGATAIVTGLVATLGMVVRRRRARRDDVLPLDPAPPLGSHLAAHEPPPAPSIEADFGPVDEPPSSPKRKPRAPRKASTAKPGSTRKASPASSAIGDSAGPGTTPTPRPKRPARVRTSPPATDVGASIEPATGEGSEVGDGS